MIVSVYIVDHRIHRAKRLWKLSGCGNRKDAFELLPAEPFNSIERTCERVKNLRPNVILVNYDLGQGRCLNGVNVVRALIIEGYKGHIVANCAKGAERFGPSGVKVDGDTNRKPRGLWNALEQSRKWYDKNRPLLEVPSSPSA